LDQVKSQIFLADFALCRQPQCHNFVHLVQQ